MHQADPRQQLLEQNVQELGSLTETEAGGRPEAKAAVGWTLLNRMSRNHVTAVDEAWRGYKHMTPPRPKTLDLARRLLLDEVKNPANGTAYICTPQSMPKEGGELPNETDIGARKALRV